MSALTTPAIAAGEWVTIRDVRQAAHPKVPGLRQWPVQPYSRPWYVAEVRGVAAVLKRHPSALAMVITPVSNLRRTEAPQSW